MYRKRCDIIVKKYYIYINIIHFREIVIPAIPYDKKCTKKEPHRPYWIVWFYH